MSERVVVIAQARAGSTRLPRKAFRKLRCGLTITEFLLRGLVTVRSAQEIVLAVPDTPGNEAFAAMAAEIGATLFHGSENDVLARYVAAAKKTNADIVVRVCGDNPLTDPFMIDQCVEAFLRERPDYLRPSGPPLGTLCEVVSMDALIRADSECADPAFREHVTMYISANADRFRVRILPIDLGAIPRPVTVDTEPDFEFVDALIDRLGGEPPIDAGRVAVALRDKSV